MNLFLFAHQDDEYAIFPVLEKLAHDSEPVTVIYLTSGDLEGNPSPARNSESTAVLRRLGLRPGQIVFLGTQLKLPDSQLHRHIERAAFALAHWCDETTRPSRIYAPAWEGGHQDHDATHIIACWLAIKYSCLEHSRQFPIYHGRGLRGIFWHTFSPLPDNGPVETSAIAWRRKLRYLRLCLQYRSQWKTWLGLLPMYAINLVARGQQILQPLNPGRLAYPPHEGRCLYERRGVCDRDQFAYHTRCLVDKIAAR